MICRVAALALLLGSLGGCATTRAPRPLTAEALARISVVCRAPNARLSHPMGELSIVLDGPSPDRPRQSQCVFEQVAAQGFWVDQIIVNNDAGL